jgi:hypothetical protein
VVYLKGSSGPKKCRECVEESLSSDWVSGKVKKPSRVVEREVTVGM